MARTLSSTLQRLKPSVFATLNERIKKVGPALLPLHIGDTYHAPPSEARLEHLDLARHGEFHRYAHPFGQTDLLEALAAKVVAENGIPAAPDWLQVTCGATQALHNAVQVLVEPGRQVALLAPYWPLFGGMCRLAGAQVEEIDFTSARGEDDLGAWVEERLPADCSLLYFCNPNNPDGYVYTPAQLHSLAELARRRDLWVVSDECYEHFLYDGARHLSIASLPGMAERTLTAFSFSKSYAMAGDRLGYLVAHPAVMVGFRRAANHTVYNVSAATQLAGLRALEHSAKFLTDVRPGYQHCRDLLWAACARRARKPAGGAYLWLDMGTADAAWDVIWKALDGGLAMAPGAAFGDAFAHCLRVCFTAAPQAGIERAAAVLEPLLG